MRSSYSTPREISRGLKRKQYSKMGGTPSSDRVIEDIDRALEELKIFFCANGASVEEIAGSNVHRRKELGKGKIVSWGGARSKGEGRKCELAKNTFFHSDLLKLCLKKK